MDLIETLYAAAAGAGMLKTAVWAPAPNQAPTVVQVGFRAADESLLGGLAVGHDYAITYPASALPGLTARERLSIDGEVYEVREVRAVGDGAECRTTLTRLS